MTRPIYSMVHEAYDVSLYRTLAGVCRDAVALELCMDDCRDEGSRPCTEAEVRKALKQGETVRLYPLKGGDWTYRIDKHEGFWDKASRPAKRRKTGRKPK